MRNAHTSGYTDPLPWQTPHFTSPEPSQLLHWLDEENAPPPTLPVPLHFGHLMDPLPLQVLQVAIMVTSFELKAE